MKVKTLIIAIVCANTIISPQNIVSESPISNINGVLYSDRITIKFSDYIFNSSSGDRTVSINQVNDGFTKLVNTMNNLNSTYGQYELRKVIPSATWGDIFRTNKRTGKTVIINEWSQVFTLKFDTLVPIDSLIDLFESFPFVEYAHQPIQAIDLVTPNDSLYGTGDQWNLTKIDAEAAWGITKGTSSIKVAVIETKGVNFRHPELQKNLFYWDNYVSADSSWHGTGVAGLVAATTDNDTMVASLGWNLGLIGLRFFMNPDDINEITLPAIIDTAIDHGADVINFSFKLLANDEEGDDCPYDYQSVGNAISDAISQGVVVVAAFGNRAAAKCDPSAAPYPIYPAMYPNVIGVTASNSLDSASTNYNYGDSVDVAAPGKGITEIFINSGSGNYTYLKNQDGTSLAAPQVAALAGLILSVDSTLTPKEVETIIEKSAEKVGQFSYTNGWNQYMGYGRINAFYAVAPPSTPTNFYGTGSQGQNPTLHWNSVVEPDVDYLELKRTVTGQGGGNTVFTLSPGTTQYTDNTIIINKFSFATIKYKLRSVDYSNQNSGYTNTKSYTGEGLWKQIAESIPASFSIQGNYPNPFNPKTIIRIGLPEISNVIVTIYDLMGKEVKTLFNGTENPGYKNIVWDSKDNGGRLVPSGMYFYKLDAISKESDKKFHETKKMVLLR